MQSWGYKMVREILVSIMIFLLLFIGNVNVSESFDVTGQNATQAQSPMEITLNGIYIKELFNLSREELISRLGEIYGEGTTAIEKSHIIFPVLFYKDEGLTFVFGAGKVGYIEVVRDSNIKGINVNGADPGMNFEEIYDKLGETEVYETWIASKTLKAYEIHYVIDGLKYKFLSRYKDGRASKLIITED